MNINRKRNTRIYSAMKRKFSEKEELEEELDGAIDVIEREEGKGIESTEDIAVLIMAMDSDKVAEDSEVQELLGEITGLPEEGVEMVMDIKASLEGKDGGSSDEDSAQETFSAIVKGVKRARKKFSRKFKFSTRRKFNEEDVISIADSIDEDILDVIPEDAIAGSVSNLLEDEDTDLTREDVVEIFSRRRKNFSINRRIGRKKSFSGLRNTLSRLQGSTMSAKRRMSGRVLPVKSRTKRDLFSNSSLGKLRPTREETTGFRKITNNRTRYQTVRPKDPRDINAGYKGELFSSRSQKMSGLDFLSKLAGK